MMRFAKTLVLGMGVLMLFSHVITALPNNTPVQAAQTTCDLCGKCGDRQPSDYDKCVACLYENPGPPPSSPKDGVSWTVLECLDTTPGGFVQQLLKVATSVVGGVIFIVMLYGGFLLLTSSGDVEKVTKGKTLIKSGIVALVLILFSVFILNFVGNDILKIPGVEEL